MRKLTWAGALTILSLTGCESSVSETYTNSSGSLALSRKDDLLYAVDTDNDVVAVVDANTEQLLTKVKVGRSPERVVVAPDETIYVSNRADNTVSVIRRGQWDAPVATLKVGLEPTGLAVSADNRTLYVVNTATHDEAETGSLQAIDTETLQTTWELKVGEEPRSIALLPGNKALISLYRQGDVVQVDLAKAEMTKSYQGKSSELYQLVNKVRLGADAQSGGGALSTLSFSSFKSRAATDLVATPDGSRAFMPVVWAREDRITRAPSSLGGYYAEGGPCALGAIATAGVVTFEANNASPLVDDLTACSVTTNSNSKDFPPTTLAASKAAETIQGPTAAAVDPTGAWLFIVNRETQNVAILPTGRRDGEDLRFNSTGSSVRTTVNVGAGANGIALTRDGKRAFVFNAFDHSVSVIKSNGNSGTNSLSNTGEIKIGDEPVGVPADVLKGRKLFFDAHNAAMSNPTTGVSCASCHLEGRDDAHVWMFPDGPRQTPALAGRMMRKTAPFHWSGEFSTLSEFMVHTTTLRMGGTGASDTMTNQVASYIDWLPQPQNPYKTVTLSEKQARGQDLFFNKAQCSTCHAGEMFTDNRMANVGTMVLSGSNTDDMIKLNKGLNTPSLLSLARSAPYLHDGSAGTLKDRLMATKNSNLHGQTKELTDAEMDDLVEYLKTL
ncbi:MAG: c-type cytochrome [Myxococcaceae bacterium]